MEGRRDQFVAEVEAAEGLRAGRRARRRRPRHRPLGLVRRLGRQDRPGARLVQPGRRAVLQLHDPRADRRGRASSRPETSSLLGLVSRLAPPLVTGNAVVLIASERRPLPAVTLSEVLATSDVPGGVVNVLTGRKAELVPVLAGAQRRRRARHVGRPRRAADRGRAARRRRHQAPPAPADEGRRSALRLARRRRVRASRMDRRLPRDEDGLAPDRRLRMAVGTGGGAAGGRPEALDAADGGAVERRVFVHATPRVVWATLHDPALTGVLFPELKLGPAAPAWPAAATTRSARARLGLLRDAARVESLEARPEARFRLRVTASGFDSEWSWRLEPVAGGTRVIHARDLRAVRSLDRDPRPARSGVAREPGRVAPARAQGARRGRPARDESTT